MCPATPLADGTWIVCLGMQCQEAAALQSRAQRISPRQFFLDWVGVSLHNRSGLQLSEALGILSRHVHFPLPGPRGESRLWLVVSARAAAD